MTKKNNEPYKNISVCETAIQFFCEEGFYYDIRLAWQTAKGGKIFDVTMMPEKDCESIVIGRVMEDISRYTKPQLKDLVQRLNPFRGNF